MPLTAEQKFDALIRLTAWQRDYGDKCTDVFNDDLRAVLLLARERLETMDPTRVDEAWLRNLGWREWEEDCPDDEREFDLFLPIADEIGWDCRLGWQSNGLYAVRMADPETYEGMAESVELLGTRNTTKPVTRGQLRLILLALTASAIVSGE